MGVYMGDDDLYIGSLLEVLNLAFGKYALNKEHPSLNGIDEIRAIQQEFEIFREGRPLVDSLRVLGVGGLWNVEIKRKWFKLLSKLDDFDSTFPNVRGGQAIVKALISHLKLQNPDPVYFMAHDMRKKVPGWRVEILKKDRPVFYMEQDFLTISLPMQPRQLKDNLPKQKPLKQGPSKPKSSKKPPKGK